MFKFESPLNQLVFSFGAGCLGLFLGALVNIVPLWVILAIGSLGILAICFAVLREAGCRLKLFRRIMGSAVVLLALATFGIPYYLSIERTIFIGDQHAQHWGHPELDVLVFRDRKTYGHEFIEGHLYKLTPVIGHRVPKQVLAGSELILDIDSRIEISKPEIWRPLDPIEGYRRFWFELPEIRFGFPKGPNEMMDLTFPGPGEYTFRWHIRGGGIAPIDRSFKIRLVKR